MTPQENADAMRTRRHTVALRRDRVPASLIFHAASGLYDCTTIEYGSDGPSIVKNWPRLSSGEQLLWRVLAWLNDAGDLPSADELRDGLDADNYAAVTKTIARAAA